jgi:hypothetical protein
MKINQNQPQVVLPSSIFEAKVTKKAIKNATIKKIASKAEKIVVETYHENYY